MKLVKGRFVVTVLVPILIAAESLSWGAVPANVVPIEVGGSFRNQNVAYVSVTVCEPGTTHCQTIPDVELDTGSTGLRLFSSVLDADLNLPHEQRDGADVVECTQFGGGDVLWGPVKIADVVLGGEKATRVPIQIADAKYASLPASCGSHPDVGPADFQANGILGISPASTDCDGQKCPGTTPGKIYYTCNGKACTEISPQTNLQVQNPVGLLPADNNGIIVSFPTIPPPEGAKSVNGSMFLGIGTRANNQPGAGAKAYATDPDGILQAEFQGKNYFSKFDTGTGFWISPVAGNLPRCSGTLNGFLCPNEDVDLNFKIIGNDGSTSPLINFVVANAQPLLNSSNLVFNDVSWDGTVLPGTFMVSLTFFFGRSVYIGIDGRTTPLGRGPYYGY